VEIRDLIAALAGLDPVSKGPVLIKVGNDYADVANLGRTPSNQLYIEAEVLPPNRPVKPGEGKMFRNRPVEEISCATDKERQKDKGGDAKDLR